MLDNYYERGRSRIRYQVLALLAAVFLAVLSGCAAGLTTKPASNAPPQPVDQEPSVARFENGWEGFMIIERAQLDDATRSDFDSAVSMLHAQDYEQAIELLENVIKHLPGVTAPHINLGMAYKQVGNREGAENQFKAALELVPDHPVACNQYGMLLRKPGRFDEARIIYEQALARFPDYYPLHRNLGILYEFYLNDLPVALEHYEIYSLSIQEDDKVKLWIADLRARIMETD